MELKNYQLDAIKNLETFLKFWRKNDSISDAFKEFWESRDVLAKPPYQDIIHGVPQVCFKVPTGGGKTFMAAASLKIIFNAMTQTQPKFVVWLVPSETILTQTCKNLSNAAHPYKQKLDTDFNMQVKVYTKEQLLMGENFAPAEVDNQLSILVLSYDSFRTANKEGRKAYQQNGQLSKFTSSISNDAVLDNADELSLIQVIRHYKPIIIVDESHHATTKLSVEMLTNFNPSFILELTATPKNTSNVIAYVPAWQLKNAGMVKLPVIVYNRHAQDEVITDAIDFRNRLEEIARAENIRPIILFQAETQGSGERATFDKIKTALINNHKIPANQIAIKTADINDLKNVDLLAANCPIRYIITINALKEGWDCPFAYILASLANRTSAVDVEQILGRILRRPYTKNFSDALLNMSYVFTASADFRHTLDKIIKGLNAAGFSEKECRAVDNTNQTVVDNPVQNVQPEAITNISNDNLTVNDNNLPINNTVSEIETIARQSEANYNFNSTNSGEIARSNEEIDRMNVFTMRDKFKDAQNILLPQFFYSGNVGSLFGGDTDMKVDKDFFRTNFSLRDKDTIIDFDNLNYEIVALDIDETEDSLRYKYLSDADAKAFLNYFDNLPKKSQIRQLAGKIAAIIDKNNTPPSKDINNYVIKVVSNFDSERLRDAARYTSDYARKIKAKIDDMLNEHAKKFFLEQINTKKIIAKPSYKMPRATTPTNFQRSWINSLYTGEEAVNRFEHEIAATLTSIDNVVWWHRNRSKNEFYINGFINHYPDFIVKLKSGVIVLVEAKGDDRDNSDSKRKLELGKIWESKAGSDKFSYFMVFDKNPLDGALTFDKFKDTIQQL